MSEDKSTGLGPDDIIRICLTHVGATKQTKIENAWRQKLRRHLKSHGWPTRVPEAAVRQIIAPDLATYFREQLPRDTTPATSTAPAGFNLAEAIGATDPLSETSIIAREEWERDSNEDRDYVAHFGEPRIQENQVINMMIRALFFEKFPDFDEAAFRADYEALSRTGAYISMAPLTETPQDREVVIQHEALKRKLDPAINRGNVSAYTMPEGQE